MPSIKKLIAKLRENPREVRFKTIKRVLEYFGYRITNVKGSHFRFGQVNREAILIVVHNNNVKKWYIKDAFKEIEKHFPAP